MRIRVVLADDHPVVREGVRTLLADEPDVEVVGQAENGDEVLTLVDGLHPDVVVLDLMMPGRSGLDLIGEVIRRGGGARVLVLSMHAASPTSSRRCAAGPRGTRSSRPRRRRWYERSGPWEPATTT